jgi:hypothetical protein
MRELQQPGDWIAEMATLASDVITYGGGNANYN